MFFEPSILEGFWEGFWRVWGNQKSKFSHFFGCFFEVDFEAHFRRRKNGPKFRKNQSFPLFGSGFAVPWTCWGEKKRGVRSILSKDLEIGALKLSIEINLVV